MSTSPNDQSALFFNAPRQAPGPRVPNEPLWTLWKEGRGRWSAELRGHGEWGWELPTGTAESNVGALTMAEFDKSERSIADIGIVVVADIP